jgi:hypothetical protein
LMTDDCDWWSMTHDDWILVSIDDVGVDDNDWWLMSYD